MCGEKARKQLNLISLSDNTVERRINEMADDITQKLVKNIRESPFYALQLDESTDIANLSNLLAFVRYVHNGELQEDFLFCKPLPAQSTAQAIFDILNAFIVSNGIDWSKCVGLSTDGARAMVGHRNGVVARVKTAAPLMSSVHSSLHREALATKKMPTDLRCVLDEAVKIVNFIKTRPLQSRLFRLLCEEMGSDHVQLLLHTEGKSVTAFQVQNKIEATIKKLDSWAGRIRKSNSESFENLSHLLTVEAMSLPTLVKKLIEEHLQGLKSQMRDYFPSPDAQLCLFPLTALRLADVLSAADLCLNLVFPFSKCQPEPVGAC
ncbi:hypothetical protein M9458_043124 [Cirrhinus mrigala]|uniref:DUF4371 domain-containing protein n=1 Tax=Cirrhinus mrigala TaxID=683832 RepID=A0ABD0NCQ3_CIRMR